VRGGVLTPLEWRGARKKVVRLIARGRISPWVGEEDVVVVAVVAADSSGIAYVPPRISYANR
jgi:hypothetical protein